MLEFLVFSVLWCAGIIGTYFMIFPDWQQRPAIHMWKWAIFVACIIFAGGVLFS